MNNIIRFTAWQPLILFVPHAYDIAYATAAAKHAGKIGAYRLCNSYLQAAKRAMGGWYMIHGTSDNSIFMFDYKQFLQKYSVYSGFSSQTQKLLIIDYLLGYANIWILVLCLKVVQK